MIHQDGMMARQMVKKKNESLQETNGTVEDSGVV